MDIISNAVLGVGPLPPLAGRFSPQVHAFQLCFIREGLQRLLALFVTSPGRPADETGTRRPALAGAELAA